MSGTCRWESYCQVQESDGIRAPCTKCASSKCRNIGVQDYGVVKTLSLCPSTPNCIATSEEANDRDHFVPAW